MRSFTALIAALFFVAVFSRASGDDFQRSLGITDAELAERTAIMDKADKQEMWNYMSSTQRERLRHAVLLDEKVPWSWNILTSYDKMVDPAYADFLWKLVHLTPAFIRDAFVNALPAIPHEDTVKAAARSDWYAALAKDERTELERRILTEHNIPAGFDSWRDAINDANIAQLVRENLKLPAESPKSLQHILGVTDKELQYRQDLFSKIQGTEIYGVMTPIQQERLRMAVLLDKPRPITWTVLTTYEKILLPENAPFLRRLVHFWPHHIRDFFLNALPRIPHEDVVQAATKHSWWSALNAEEQSNITKSILLEKNIPQGFDSWRAALNDPNIATWIQNNKDKIVV